MKTMNRLKLMLLLVLPSVSEHDSSRVVGRTGQDVTLPCRYEVKKHGLQSVCWNRGDLPLQECNNRLIATSKLRVKEETRVSSRYQLQGRLDEGDVSLTILNLTESDAGRYGCRVRVRGPFNDLKYHIDLNIEKGEKLLLNLIKFVQEVASKMSLTETRQFTAAEKNHGLKHCRVFPSSHHNNHRREERK
uniref:Ig-like domain-containing protein n=1 Tax=Lates calcarifer TaxID=8187 RepID=A0A4W6EU82_LATCA